MKRERSTDTAAQNSSVLDATDERVLDVLERTLRYARVRRYTGWDYGDGMSSRILQSIPVENKWLNVAFQEAVKRAPVNVRPLLLVERRRNYMGAALFAMANQTTASLVSAPSMDNRRTDADSHRIGQSESVDYDREAHALADWLVEHSIHGYSGYCAGFQHPIQHLDGRGDAQQPDVVNTSFGVKALLRASEYDRRYASVVRSAPEFVLGHLNYDAVTDSGGAVVDYHTKHPQDYYTINAGALCARMFLDLYARFGDSSLRERATELLDHIAYLQTDRGGWYYRDPPEASHLSMDTHHNGFVIEVFQRYRAVADDDRYDDTLGTALEFFREELFDDDGAPNFDEKSTYPRDIHASTQGALVFTYEGDLGFARRILEWVFDELSAGDGQFYTCKKRFYTQRVTLMRWCQAWMAFAMSEYLAARASLPRE